MLTELIERRLAHVKHFDTGTIDPATGLPVLRMLTQRGLHHRRADSKWYENDVNWQDAGTAFRPGLLGFDLDLNKSTRTLSLLFPGESQAITLSPRNVRTPTVTRSGNTVTLAGLWRGIDLELTLTPEGIKADYTRTSATFTSPSWTVTGPFEKYKRQPYYIDPNTGLVVPVADSLVGGVWSLDMGAVPIGVVCDPTLTLQPDAAAGKDTSLSINAPNYNMGISSVLYLGSGSTGLLDFDLSSISAGSTITAVVLSLYHSYGTVWDLITCRRILVPWVEGTKDYATAAIGQPCWNWRQYNTAAWGASGAQGLGTDVGITGLATSTFGSPTGDWHTWSDAALVTDVQQRIGGAAHYGWAFIGSNALINVDSSDSATASNRPKFEVTYTAGATAKPAYYYGMRRR